MWVASAAQGVGKAGEEQLHLVAAVGLGPKQSLIAERWQPQQAALLQRRVGEMAIAVLGQILQQGVLGMVALQHHQPRLAGATGTARHLDVELGQFLGGAKIGTEQGTIHIQQSYQCHVREVVALGQHLGADQDLVLARLDVTEVGLQLPLATGVVPIDAHHRILRENGAEQLLQLFCADPGSDQINAATLRAVVG